MIRFSAQSSIHPATGLRKTFFFPGFSDDTGGLIREQHLTAKREAAKAEFKRLPSLQVSLFCYPHAPIHSLLSAMAEGEHSVECFVPTGSALGKIAEFFGRAQIEIGDTLSKQKLRLTTRYGLSSKQPATLSMLLNQQK
jgi:hypothetical protein